MKIFKSVTSYNQVLLGFFSNEHFFFLELGRDYQDTFILFMSAGRGNMCFIILKLRIVIAYNSYYAIFMSLFTNFFIYKL